MAQGDRCANSSYARGDAQQLIARLPNDLAPGAYTLTVVNQAGSCSTEISLLRGEQGEKGEPGSYVVGEGLVQEADVLSVDPQFVSQTAASSTWQPVGVFRIVKGDYTHGDAFTLAKEYDPSDYFDLAFSDTRIVGFEVGEWYEITGHIRFSLEIDEGAGTPSPILLASNPGKVILSDIVGESTGDRTFHFSGIFKCTGEDKPWQINSGVRFWLALGAGVTLKVVESELNAHRTVITVRKLPSYPH